MQLLTTVLSLVMALGAISGAEEVEVKMEEIPVPVVAQAEYEQAAYEIVDEENNTVINNGTTNRRTVPHRPGVTPQRRRVNGAEINNANVRNELTNTNGGYSYDNGYYSTNTNVSGATNDRMSANVNGNGYATGRTANGVYNNPNGRNTAYNGYNTANNGYVNGTTNGRNNNANGNYNTVNNITGMTNVGRNTASNGYNTANNTRGVTGANNVNGLNNRRVINNGNDNARTPRTLELTHHDYMLNGEGASLEDIYSLSSEIAQKETDLYILKAKRRHMVRSYVDNVMETNNGTTTETANLSK